jgi:hypothetical protein
MNAAAFLRRHFASTADHMREPAAKRASEPARKQRATPFVPAIVVRRRDRCRGIVLAGQSRSAAVQRAG